MISRRWSKAVSAVAAGVLAVGLTACGSEDPLTQQPEGSGTPSDSAVIAVGSADFTENVLLAEIYAGALRGAGKTVTTKLRVGTRETLVKGLVDTSISVVPEYSGNLLAFLDKEATATQPEEVYTELEKAVPEGLTVLDQSPAEDSDVLVVTTETAEANNLESLEDLGPLCGQFVLGAAGEWKDRWEAKIQEVYGCTFKEIRTTDAAGPVTVEALSSNQVQVANLFTTASAIEANGFVQLQDTKRMYPAQNIVPLARETALDEGAREALNKVSEALTTDRLTALVERIEVDKENAADVAADFLRDAGIPAA